MVANEEDDRARARRDLGLSRELQQERTSLSDPARGGCRGYPVWFRMEELAKWQAGEETRASVSSLVRWQDEHLNPYRMAGGSDRDNLIGWDQFLLVVFLFIYPEAQEDEIAMFIYENGEGNVYSRSVVSRRLREMKFTSKKASTEAYQAFTPRNLLREELFFTRGLPLGIFEVPRRTLVDFDECGVSLERTNRRNGHGMVGLRIRKPGHYTRDTKLTVLFAMEPGNPMLPANQDGSLQRPRRWVWVRQAAGTDAVLFADFVDHVCTSIEDASAHTGDTERVLMWDNLASHLAPLVHHTVNGRQGPVAFSTCSRPPYKPKYGPTEYAFCELICRLQDRAKPNWNLNTLRFEILQVIANLGMDGSFDATFQHCGYNWI
jgi:hypothetical protein